MQAKSYKQPIKFQLLWEHSIITKQKQLDSDRPGHPFSQLVQYIIASHLLSMELQLSISHYFSGCHQKLLSQVIEDSCRTATRAGNVKICTAANVYRYCYWSETLSSRYELLTQCEQIAVKLHVVEVEVAGSTALRTAFGILILLTLLIQL